MCFFAVLAVCRQPLFLLEGDHGALSFRAEVRVRAVFRQRTAKLQKKLLHGFHVVARHAFDKLAAAQRVFRRGYDNARLAVVDERELVPVRPFPVGHLRLDAAVVEAAPFHGTPASDVISHMPVEAERHAGQFGKRADHAPVHTLALCPLEHAVGGFVRTAIPAVLARKRLVRTDGFYNADPAARPSVPFAAADAVRADLLVCDVCLITRGATVTIMRRILLGFSGEQALGTFVHDRPIPVGLSDHFLAPCREVFIRERGINSLCHVPPPFKRGGGYSPLPLSVVSSVAVSDVLSLSERLCSWDKMLLSLSGTGSPRCAAFSSMDTPSLLR